MIICVSELLGTRGSCSPWQQQAVKVHKASRAKLCLHSTEHRGQRVACVTTKLKSLRWPCAVGSSRDGTGIYIQHTVYLLRESRRACGDFPALCGVERWLIFVTII